MGQLPLVILMSGKKSPIACLCGIDMNQLMTFHRWIARMVWCQVNVHAFGYTVIALTKSHLARNFQKAYWNWGVMVRELSLVLTLQRCGFGLKAQLTGFCDVLGVDSPVNPRDQEKALRGMI